MVLAPCKFITSGTTPGIILKFAALVAVLVMSTSLCRDCRGSGGVYIDEDFQVQFECCLKCNGYGMIYGDNDES